MLTKIFFSKFIGLWMATFLYLILEYLENELLKLDVSQSRNDLIRRVTGINLIFSHESNKER